MMVAKASCKSMDSSFGRSIAYREGKSVSRVSVYSNKDTMHLQEHPNSWQAPEAHSSSSLLVHPHLLSLPPKYPCWNPQTHFLFSDFAMIFNVSGPSSIHLLIHLFIHSLLLSLSRHQAGQRGLYREGVLSKLVH